ncbi:hypothetical protein HDU80_000625 [Chytriomyces hyalinus]|nr:hypothetical protein HDU80_000625 [Chytriomyces hyalinus]
MHSREGSLSSVANSFEEAFDLIVVTRLSLSLPVCLCLSVFKFVVAKFPITKNRKPNASNTSNSSRRMQWTRTVLAVLISIWTVGVLLNGFVLLAMVLRRSLFAFNEHLRTIGTLLLLCQTWSLVNVINDVVYLLYGNHDSSFYAILSNTVLILIFGANFILSLERFYTVCKDVSLRLRHYLVIYSVLFVFIVAVVAVIIVSVSVLRF